MKLIADFNSVENGDIIYASLLHRIPTSYYELPPTVGSIVTLDDCEGNSALGSVESVDDNLLKVRIDWNSWGGLNIPNRIYNFSNKERCFSEIPSPGSFGPAIRAIFDDQNSATSVSVA